jgi:hypothetical protein
MIAWLVAIITYLDAVYIAGAWVTTANVIVDDGPPERLDDTGATSVVLAPRGDGAVAVMVDARAALTLVHARTLSMVGRSLAIGTLTPVFVGNPPRRGAPHPAIAAGGASRAFALVTLPDDESRMGMFAIAIDDPPWLDASRKWSEYPSVRGNVAIAASRGASRAWVARTHAQGDDASAPYVIELGRLDATSGAFESLGEEPIAGDARAVAIEEDAAGDLWLLFTDGSGTYVERRRCP